MCHRKGKKSTNQEGSLNEAKEQRDNKKTALGEFMPNLKVIKKSGIENKSGKS